MSSVYFLESTFNKLKQSFIFDKVQYKCFLYLLGTSVVRTSLSSVVLTDIETD